MSPSQVLPTKTLSLSYYGELVKHPGIAIDLSHNIIASKLRENKFPRHLFQGGLNLSYYSHRKSHYAISFTPNANYQFLFNNGMLLRFNAGLGYLRQFNYGKTYEVTNNNTVKEVKWAGRNKFITTYSLGFGQNLMLRRNIPLGWHFDLGMFTEGPSNTGFIPHLFLKVGVDYYFNFKK